MSAKRKETGTMMNLLDIFLLSVALAMDCFTVSIVSGIIIQRPLWRVILQTSILFGLFQAAMPMAGWLGMAHFASHVSSYGHWIAFALLVLIGGNMIRESFSPDEEAHFNPRKLKTQLLLAVATSIDALAIGVSMAVTGYDSLHSIILPLTLIGVTSFLFAWIGYLLGINVGPSISKRLKPELLGGIILVLIGFKVLLF